MLHSWTVLRRNKVFTFKKKKAVTGHSLEDKKKFQQAYKKLNIWFNEKIKKKERKLFRIYAKMWSNISASLWKDVIVRSLWKKKR